MQTLLGTTVNAIAIIVGGFLGLLLKKGISEKVKENVMSGLSLCVMLVGLLGSLKVNNFILVIISFTIGAIIGELIDFDKKFQLLGDSIEAKLKGKGGRVSEAFVTSSLLFCVGAMAIVGSLESGLTNNNQTIFAKSIIDGIASVIFASSLGVGVLLAAVPVFLYQGTITLCATFLRTILVSNVIADMTAIGSLIIIGLSLNMLKVTKIKVANLLPAIFIPIIYQLLNIYFTYIKDALPYLIK